MDIKGALSAILPMSTKKTEKPEKAIKSDSTTDRDANGQMAQDQGKGQKRPPMTDEEFQKAIAHIESLEAVKNNQIRVEISSTLTKKMVTLIEPNGKIFRRIVEEELWELVDAKANERGQLISKSA